MITQAQTLWDGLEPRRKLIAALGVVAIVAAIFGISRVAGTPSMVLLYSGLDPSASGEIISALEADGVAFEVRDTSILVPADKRDRLRMDLAGQGLPAGGAAGYEILDNLSGFGTTSQMFDAAYWRAKEGELARTITGTPNVRAARVHLAAPIAQPFGRTPASTASVTVTMARGSLDQEQARAIRFLVSSAISGLPPESVAVIDSVRGVVLADAEAARPIPEGASPSERADTLRGNIQRLVEARVGPGRAIVEVNVDADMDTQTITERVIDPQSRVAISSETEESSENAQGSNPGVTVASNLPDGDVEGGSGQNNRQSSQSRERQNFEVSETRRERTVVPGQIRKITVAVLVDGVRTTATDGTESWEARPQAEIDTLRTLVESAIGFDRERGDTVTIESLEFSLPPEQGSLVERGGDGFLAANGASLVQVAVLAAMVLALIFFVLRPMMSRPPAGAFAELTGPREVGLDPARIIEAERAAAANDFLELPPQTLTKIDRLRDVISSRSEDSAAVLRSWIESPDSRKEPAGS